MANKKNGEIEFNLLGKCFSCKKNSKLADLGGLKLCKKCVDKFDEQLIKSLEQQEYGEDIVRDQKNKQKD
jgi:hypothetical protein